MIITGHANNTPMRYHGRDIIKVRYQQDLNKSDYIEQGFYRSSGSAEKSVDTTGNWFPMDGIVYDIGLTHVATMGFHEADVHADEEEFQKTQSEIGEMTNKDAKEYTGNVSAFYMQKNRRKFYLDKQLNPNVINKQIKAVSSSVTNPLESKAGFKVAKIGDYVKPFSPVFKSLQREQPDAPKDILQRLGSSELTYISFLLSSKFGGNRVFSDERGTPDRLYVDKRTGDHIFECFEDGEDIPMGIDTQPAMINEFLGDALSFNHIDIGMYKMLKRQYGKFDLRDFNADPKLRNIVMYDALKNHIDSPEGQAINKFVKANIDIFPSDMNVKPVVSNDDRITGKKRKFEEYSPTRDNCVIC